MQSGKPGTTSRLARHDTADSTRLLHHHVTRRQQSLDGGHDVSAGHPAGAFKRPDHFPRYVTAAESGVALRKAFDQVSRCLTLSLVTLNQDLGNRPDHSHAQAATASSTRQG